MSRGVYQRKYKPLSERFWEFASKAGAEECWGWNGSIDRLRYGRIWHGKSGKSIYAHRLSLMLPIRGIGVKNSAAKRAAKTHCPHDHPYSSENTYVDKRGSRSCRTCCRLRARKTTS